MVSSLNNVHEQTLFSLKHYYDVWLCSPLSMPKLSDRLGHHHSEYTHLVWYTQWQLVIVVRLMGVEVWTHFIHIDNNLQAMKHVLVSVNICIQQRFHSTQQFACKYLILLQKCNTLQIATYSLVKV